MSEGILPGRLNKVKIFTHRAEFTLKDDDWVYSGGDPNSLDSLVNDWIEDTQALVQVVASPQVSIGYNHEKNIRVIYTAVSVVYLPAVEQKKEKTYGKTREGNAGVIADRVEPGNTAITPKLSGDGELSGDGVSGAS